MNCADFDRWWQQKFDLDTSEGALDEFAWADVPAVQRQHLEHCERCQTLLESGRLLAESIPAWRACSPQADLTDQILAAWRRQSTTPRVRVSLPSGRPAPASRTLDGDHREVWIRRAFGVASVVALAVGAWFSFDRLEPASTDFGAVDSTDVADASSPLRPDSNQNDPAFHLFTGNARERLPPQSHWQGDRPIAEATAEAIQDVAALVDPERNGLDRAQASRNARSRRLSPGGLSRLGLVAAAESRVFERLEIEIRPIGREVGKTLDFLRIVGQVGDDSR